MTVPVAPLESATRVPGAHWVTDLKASASARRGTTASERVMMPRESKTRAIISKKLRSSPWLACSVYLNSAARMRCWMVHGSAHKAVSLCEVRLGFVQHRPGVAQHFGE